jgi:predicted nucleic acid-binding protein
LHLNVRNYLLAQLADPKATLAVTPLVLHEFIHVVTDGHRFDPPVSMVDAMAIARLYLEHSNVECLAADRDAMAAALVLLERHELGRNRIADTLFAAILLRHGVTELITTNPADFAVFQTFTLIDPTAG